MVDSRGFVKIGKSQNPKYREKTLQSEDPSIEMFAVNNNDVELELHRKFKSKRIRGEWFNLDADDLNWIRNKYDFKSVNEGDEE